jgi:hypothetical protein
MSFKLKKIINCSSTKNKQLEGGQQYACDCSPEFIAAEGERLQATETEDLLYNLFEEDRPLNHELIVFLAVRCATTEELDMFAMLLCTLLANAIEKKILRETLGESGKVGHSQLLSAMKRLSKYPLARDVRKWALDTYECCCKWLETRELKYIDALALYAGVTGALVALYQDTCRNKRISHAQQLVQRKLQATYWIELHKQRGALPSAENHRDNKKESNNEQSS